MMVLKYLERHEIDDHQWDQTIENAANGMPYGYSWYLDCVTKRRWGALVTEDYRYVMPLPWNKKWFGFRQVYQPAFTQQLGIFGKTKPTEDVAITFLDLLPHHSRYTAVNLNEGNAYIGSQVVTKWRTNMILSLDRSYEQIRKGYRGSLLRRVKRAQDQLSFNTNQISSDDVVNMFRDNLNHKFGLGPKDYELIKQLIDEALFQNKGVIYSTKHESETLASIFFLKSHGRLIQLFGSATIRGKEMDATHFLLDGVIKTNCNKPLVLDFEGSELPGVASFFRGFGPEEVRYAHVVINEFPFWIKALKRLLNR